MSCSLAFSGTIFAYFLRQIEKIEAIPQDKQSGYHPNIGRGNGLSNAS
jgi:hypothetical protein